jgi:multidrug efflux pump subunit AcrA (membrane-fusion protein)
MKKTAIYASLCILAVILSGCGRAEKAKKEKDTAVPVKVMEVKPRDISRALEYIGTIKGRDEATVYPKVSGKIIEKVKDEGAPVAKGEAIAYIDRDEVGLKFEKAPVESPLTGTVGRVYVDIGSNVTTQTPIALVSDMEGVEIDLDVPEKYLHEISLGKTAVVSVDAYPGAEFTGRVSQISPVIDVETRSAPVEITIIDKTRRLQSGMFTKVKLILDEHMAVPVIIKEAIVGKKPDTYVYIVEGAKAVLTKVKLGIREGSYYEVTEGLSGGDLVVIMGQQKLRDGASVTVEREG